MFVLVKFGSLPKAALNDAILFASHAFARTRSICLLFVLCIISKQIMVL